MTLASNAAFAAYRAAAATVHPRVAVVRLYDVALRSIRQAILANRDRKIEDAYIAINKACQVLRGLSSNIIGDDDMAQTLRQTYLANMISLHSAFGKPDAEQRYVRIAAGLLELRNAWAGVAGMAPSNDLVAATTSIR
ncbi:MAG: flagellar protein FliS [Candidatus Devosia phytovorans]|uniref:Flagellar protein FliS n=1 Tax=Candidatus Devosia phytovorans TaxID=3121372 RepID=A0AAJ5VSG8_9HYPH|nr:flagellar protein FliS [Devosia sp.]WEK03295.1 MAG: flagellar protein FliS [Devosia sp.]